MSTETTAAACEPRIHLNRLSFSGILARVDRTSDKPPHGSQEHRVMLSRAAAEEALWSLKGMAVSFAVQWDGHDARRKCGVIEDAWLDGDLLRVAGYIYCRDFPEIRLQWQKAPEKMGMSYECANVHVENMKADVWVMTRVIFTGAAILFCEKAAYTETSFTIMAAASRFDGNVSFISGFEPTGEVALQD